MRLSTLFWRTLREKPSELVGISDQLLLRAGFITVANNQVGFLPLGQRLNKKLLDIVRQSMNQFGAQEVRLPVNLGSDKLTWDLERTQDRKTNTSHEIDAEEYLREMLQQIIQSYRQLPVVIYQFQQSLNTEQEAHQGLSNSDLSGVLSSYSISQDINAQQDAYSKHQNAFKGIFQKCDLPFKLIRSNYLLPGCSDLEEMIFLTDSGNQTYCACEKCGSLANNALAKFKKLPSADQQLEALDKVYTPAASSIEALANYLKLPQTKTAKAMFFSAVFQGQAHPQTVFAILRGDMDVSDTKLIHVIEEHTCKKLVALYLASEEEIRKIGAVPGFASPLSIDRSEVILIVDDLIPQSTNLVCGANEVDYHFLNSNYGRDYSADVVADIAQAKQGSACPACGSHLAFKKGLQIGYLSQNSPHLLDTSICSFLDENGKRKDALIGQYQINLSNLLKSVVETHHDEAGLILPAALAPFSIHLIVLPSKDSQVQITAENLYTRLIEEGYTVLFDDRDERAGVKFNDADLIGLPLRITVSERSLAQAAVEVKRRDQSIKTLVKIEDVKSFIQVEMCQLSATLN